MLYPLALYYIYHLGHRLFRCYDALDVPRHIDVGHIPGDGLVDGFGHTAK